MRRIARILRAEDVLMLVLAGLVLPIVGRLLAGDAAAQPQDPSPIVGLLGLAAIGGVIAVVVTRGPDEPAPLDGGQMTLQGWARFPLAAGTGIVGIQTLPAIGLPAEPLIVASFGAMFVGAMAFSRLPVVPVAVRRFLVLPMSIVAAGAFSQVMDSGLEEIAGGFVTGSVPREMWVLAPFVIAAVLVMYTMLVIAPRSIADPGASWGAWAVRFLLLLATIGILAVLGG